MRVRMKIQILGTRDGVRWPAPGNEVDLPEYEATKLLNAGFASPVKVTREERAVAPDTAERRTRARAKADE